MAGRNSKGRKKGGRKQGQHQPTMVHMPPRLSPALTSPTATPPPRPSGSNKELIFGVVLGLIPWGLGLIGEQTNIWLGGIILATSFGLVAHYLFYKSAWARPWKILATIVSGLMFFGCVGMKMRAQYVVEHPPSVAAEVQSLRIGATQIGVLNVPEHKRLAISTDGKLWNENRYADIRVAVENTSDYSIESVDLAISITKRDEHSLMAGIGQLSDVAGVEFLRPKMPEFQIGIKGQDGNIYNEVIGFGDLWHPVKQLRVFCPRLLSRTPLNLIIAAIHGDNQILAPTELRITGSYLEPSSANRRVSVDELVQVTGRTRQADSTQRRP